MCSYLYYQAFTHTHIEFKQKYVNKGTKKNSALEESRDNDQVMAVISQAWNRRSQKAPAMFALREAFAYPE